MTLSIRDWIPRFDTRNDKNSVIPGVIPGIYKNKIGFQGLTLGMTKIVSSLASFQGSIRIKLDS